VSAERRGPVRAVVVTIALVVLGGLVLAWIVPPRHVEYGGGDEENYLANGVRIATSPDAGYDFLPPEWQELPDEQREDLAAAFLDAEGRMFRLGDLLPDADDAEAPVLVGGVTRKKATVDEDGDIRIAHDNLYATFLAGLVRVEDRHLPYLANDVLLAAAGLLFALIVYGIVERRGLAVAAGALLVALPSMIEAARVTRTETFALVLFLGFVWLTMRDKGRTAWPGLLLVALWATRHEFIIPLLAYVAWSSWRRRPGGWALVVATVGAAYLHPWGLAEAGQLFPSSRDVFAKLPTTPAWVLLPLYGIGQWGSKWLADVSDRWAAAWGRVGESRGPPPTRRGRGGAGALVGEKVPR
jgi:hypothetical protein